MEIHSSEKKVKEHLVTAYKIVSYMGLDDLVCTHLSARCIGSNNFYICPFGISFNEVTEKNLLCYNIETGECTGDGENQIGYVMHSSIYRERFDINSIFHLQTSAGIAVSAMKCGLLQASRFSMIFHNVVSYHLYNSLTLSPGFRGKKIAEDLGAKNKVMLMRNHGTLTCGSNIIEAFYYTRFLEKACEIQCKLLAAGGDFLLPNRDICKSSSNAILNSEDHIGKNDWDAAVRALKNGNKII